ncbi:MAG TPA: glutamate-5-semialdehyde dehydrogenase [Bacteroidales bacterium]|nr:glutamate-5-semialdehyde dehydrogenase [Bacteroidales bacterium]
MKTLTDIFRKARAASLKAAMADRETITNVLIGVADSALANTDRIMDANRKDLEKMEMSDPNYDRLMLTPERISTIAGDIRNIADLPFPQGKIISESQAQNGLVIKRLSVPFGVVGIIYEARPNVTFDVFSLCFKSGNVCILKGGSDAIHSNTAIVEIIRDVLESNGVDPDMITLLPAGRRETIELLNAREFVDLIIPRGSRGLIDYVRENAKVPVIETGAGICHTYFDEFGDSEKGKAIINNAKTRRVSVCNALDCLIVHENRIADLPDLVSLCSGSGVIIYADPKAFKALKGKYPEDLLRKATEESFGTEFLSYKMAVKTVASINEALEHIDRYGSRHSEAIISENNSRVNLFISSVDASSVYSNTSTAFTDGAQFGLGAEIGISTQKLHARGPMALEALTTYKWIIEGNGQVRK